MEMKAFEHTKDITSLGIMDDDEGEISQSLSSSLVSLGVVGALSVVRFRTAVKEPYNLSFIPLAICVGISIGASQYTFAFLICFFGCLISFFLSKINKTGKQREIKVS